MLLHIFEFALMYALIDVMLYRVLRLFHLLDIGILLVVIREVFIVMAHCLIHRITNAYKGEVLLLLLTRLFKKLTVIGMLIINAFAIIMFDKFFGNGRRSRERKF